MRTNKLPYEVVQNIFHSLSEAYILNFIYIHFIHCTYFLYHFRHLVFFVGMKIWEQSIHGDFTNIWKKALSVTSPAKCFTVLLDMDWSFAKCKFQSHLTYFPFLPPKNCSCSIWCSNAENLPSSEQGNFLEMIWVP